MPSIKEMKSVPEEQIVTTTAARTRVESSRSILNWEIQNIDVLLLNEDDFGLVKSETDEHFKGFKALRSPSFKTTFGQTETTQSEQKWYVLLDVNMKSEASTTNFERHISLFLQYKASDICLVEPSRIIVSFFILGGGNRVLVKNSFGATFAKMKSADNVSGWGFPKFISLKKLWENRNTHLVNNTLRIKVVLEVYGSPKMEIMDMGSFECESSAGSKKLVDDMRQLLKSGKDADITIRCGRKAFQVHSNILKGRSSVFERMLESGMKESEDKIIKIKDVDPRILGAFLEYIYTAQVVLNVESMDKAFGLVRVADMYGIEELKAVCLRFIIEHMSLQNAAEIAVLTYQLNAGERLRSNIVAFCHTNWSELAKLPGFKECVSKYPLAFFKDIPSSTN